MKLDAIKLRQNITKRQQYEYFIGLQRFSKVKLRLSYYQRFITDKVLYSIILIYVLKAVVFAVPENEWYKVTFDSI